MCIIERSRSAHSLGAEALEQGDAERAVETLSEGIKSASEDDHHKVRAPARSGNSAGAAFFCTCGGNMHQPAKGRCPRSRAAG